MNQRQKFIDIERLILVGDKKEKIERIDDSLSAREHGEKEVERRDLISP